MSEAMSFSGDSSMHAASSSARTIRSSTYSARGAGSMRARDGGDAGDPQDDSVRSTLPGADASLPVAVAILAAGLSRRMGTLNKLVQEVDGAPMVRRVALQVLAAGGDRVFVVLGHEAEQVRDALSGLPVGFVDNHDYREGLAASVRVAARAAQPGEALMICLGDMPQV